MTFSRPPLVALATILLLTPACGVTTRTPTVKAQARAPDFTLPDQYGNKVTLEQLAAKDGYAVLVFYRGHW